VAPAILFRTGDEKITLVSGAVRVIFVAVVIKSNIQTVQHGQRNKNSVCENDDKSN